MGSRAGSDVARLRRLRRLAARHGLAVLATIKPNPRLPNSGYMLNDDETRQTILGNRPEAYSATLDQIEEYLDRLGEEDGEAGKQ